MMFTLAMSTEMAITYGPEQTLQMAKDLGFKAVEIIPAMWTTRSDPVAPSEKEVVKLKQMLDAYELQAVSVNAWFLPPENTWQEEQRFFPDIDYVLPRANRDEYTDLLKGLVQMSAALDISVINIFTYPYIGRNDKQTLSQFAAGIHDVLKKAKNHNIYVCLEQDVLCRLMRTIEGLESIINNVNHPLFKITFDPSNFYMVGIEPYPFAYQRLKTHIHHIHLRNSCVFQEGAPPEERFFLFTGNNVPDNQYCRFLSLEKGAINMCGLIRHLVADSFNRIITFQPLNQDLMKIPEILKKDVAFIHRIMDDEML